MQTPFERVETAVRDLQQGKMIILTDDLRRENEGDLIVAAECITSDTMNFMIRNGSGIVCLSILPEKASQLHIRPMVPASENHSYRETPFGVSIDAKRDITTGVSSADRARTVLAAVNDHVTPDDLVRPGHIFPLISKDGGVLEREGHTEGACDLARLAGFQPAAVLSEIMNENGTMASGEQLAEFAQHHQLSLLSIEDLIDYRQRYEDLIEHQTSAEISLEGYGNFLFTVIKERISGLEHTVLIKKNTDLSLPTLVRVHSSCMTGDLFHSERCDCNKQLHYSLQQICERGGLLIYLNQEGRGLGLSNKIKAYALQDNGLDTVEANEVLGLPIDARRYNIAANILRNLGITDIKLLTNNPRKIDDLRKYGIENIDREPIVSVYNKHNYRYLMTKRQKLDHDIKFDLDPSIIGGV